MIARKKKFSNGAEIHPIGIGTWGIGGGMVANSENDDRDINAIRYSLQKGQNHIDTAEMYGAGHSEEVVGKAIKGFERKKLFIATKVWRNNATNGKIPRAAEGSLERLDTDYIDLLYIHACWDEKEISEYVKGLNKARDEGYTRAIGLSNFNSSQLRKALSKTSHPFLALQNCYNLMHQHEVDEKMKAFCHQEEIMIVAYSPLEGALRNKTIDKIARKYRKTPAQIAINWLIAQKNVITIPKSKEKAYIDENLGAMEFEMELGDIEMLNSVG